MAQNGERKRRAHESDESVFELRKPVASATLVDGSVWRVYACVGEVMDGDVSLWAVRQGSDPRKLEFVDFRMTEEGKEQLLVWAIRECAKHEAKRSR